jgi:hypothetical protein
MIANTVAHLKAKIANLDDNAVIILDGCDCAQEWGGQIEVDKFDGSVELIRSDHGAVQLDGEPVVEAAPEPPVRKEYLLS